MNPHFIGISKWYVISSSSFIFKIGSGAYVKASMTFLVWRYGCCGSCIAIDADWLTTLGDFGNLETVSKVFHTKGNGGGRKIRKEEARGSS